MKNRIPFAALTFAFTIAGACVAHAFHGFMVDGSLAVVLIAFVGGIAAAFSADIF